MPRRKPVVISPERKKELRRAKSRERRQARKAQSSAIIADSQTPTDDQQLWSGIKARMNAMKVLNDVRERPYWLSIVHGSSLPPLQGYFPCTSFFSKGRWYYGFLFREHREKIYRRWRKAGRRVKKEFTGGVDQPLRGE